MEHFPTGLSGGGSGSITIDGTKYKIQDLCSNPLFHCRISQVMVQSTSKQLFCVALGTESNRTGGQFELLFTMALGYLSAGTCLSNPLHAPGSIGSNVAYEPSLGATLWPMTSMSTKLIRVSANPPPSFSTIIPPDSMLSISGLSTNLSASASYKKFAAWT